ncbi:hypothetical protein [Gray Lodge virus]|uniref:Uncharacterized protein n=1 Tax=Gray Lodge virus TaxID=1272942 RepID=A0A0D3R2D6_9RHAB|nr:hypothetical protein [Gray Lodge virus]AJR28580.1 hypothetical protein [Gray Lodge virus]
MMSWMTIPNQLYIILSRNLSLIGPIVSCKYVVKMSQDQKILRLVILCQPQWIQYPHPDKESLNRLIRMYLPPWIHVTWIVFPLCIHQGLVQSSGGSSTQ